MKDYILKTKDITKIYGKNKALDKVSIELKKGEIYGLIGRNGAGKTTLLKTISGLSFPTQGEVFLFGKNIDSDNNLLERIGVLIENPGIYPNLSAYENMKLKCLSYGINKEGYIESLLEQVGLENVGKKKTKEFSLGMKQRLGLALALVGEPDLLLLDEPVSGLDPQGIIEIRDILLKLNKEKNITIIISSHILEELAKLSTRFGIIDNGQIIKEIYKEELLEKVKDKIEIKTDQVEKTVNILEEKFKITNLKVIDNTNIHVYEKLEKSGDINVELSKAGIKVDSLSINQGSLEEYYINLTGGPRHA